VYGMWGRWAAGVGGVQEGGGDELLAKVTRCSKGD